MSIKVARVSSQAKEQLIRLKVKTGISQWNILCRWAFCVSLAEPSPPTPIKIVADSNVEMAWPVFGGDHHELYLGLLKGHCEQDGLGQIGRCSPPSVPTASASRHWPSGKSRIRFVR